MRPFRVRPKIGKSEEKRGKFDHQSDMRINALLLGINGVKIHIDREFRELRSPN